VNESRPDAMDVIAIDRLEVFCRVGVPADERRRPQRLLISVEMEMDVSRAAAADDLRFTIDYAAVSQRITQLAGEREWRLIETLAVAIAEDVLRAQPAEKVRVEVAKFILPRAGQVRVRVERGRP
jgi:dihydroneopterin aldolase